MIRVEYRNRVGNVDIERTIEVSDIDQLTAQERAVVIGLPVRISESVCEDCCTEREEVDNSTTDERMNDMQFDQVGAIMFYDKDNALVGSVGVESGTYTEEQIESIAKGALMGVFSTEEVARIAYFKVETHHLLPHKGDSTEPEGRVGFTEGAVIIEATPSSYTQNLVEHGLFEKDFYIKHKLDLLRILRDGDGFEIRESLIVRSLMKDLGVDSEECSENTSESG